MTHADIQDRLPEWIDGELDAGASAAVSEHLGGCAACSGEAARLRRLGAALFSKAAPADPRATEAFVARVMERVAAESVSPLERFASLFLAPAFGLALAGLLLAIDSPGADEDAPLGVAMSIDADAVLGVAP